MCLSYRDSRVSAADRPAFMEELCRTKPGPGVIAFVDGTPAGWCSVAPRSTYRRLMNPGSSLLDDRDPWSAVCFVVRAGSCAGNWAEQRFHSVSAA